MKNQIVAIDRGGAYGERGRGRRGQGRRRRGAQRRGRCLGAAARRRRRGQGQRRAKTGIGGGKLRFGKRGTRNGAREEWAGSTRGLERRRRGSERGWEPHGAGSRCVGEVHVWINHIRDIRSHRTREVREGGHGNLTETEKND